MMLQRSYQADIIAVICVHQLLLVDKRVNLHDFLREIKGPQPSSGSEE